MELDAAIASLDEVQHEMHEKFPGQVDRLAQLDAHLATARMVVEHMHDEAVRHGEED